MYTNFKRLLWHHMKPLCFAETIKKTVAVPIALFSAYLLSDIVTNATLGRVRVVISESFVMLGVTLFTVMYKSAFDMFIQKRQSKAINQCRIDFLDAFFGNPVNILFKSNRGELIENINDDISSLTKCFYSSYPNIISSVIAISGYTVYLALKKPIVAVSLIAISLLQLFPPLIVKKYMQINYDASREIEAKITNHTIEAISGFEVIKLYGIKEWWLSKLSKYHKEYIVVGKKTDAVAATQRSMYRLLDNILRYGTYILLGIYVMLEYCTMDVAIEAIYLSREVFPAVKLLFSTIPDFAVSKNAERRIEKCFLHSDKPNRRPADIDNIVIDSVSCSYENRTVIDGLDCHFNTDNNYLILGKNGAGKTTLIHLIVGLAVPDKGNIYLGSDTFCGWDYQGSFKDMFFVPQDDLILNIKANDLINLFDCDTREAFFEVARQFDLTKEMMNSDIRELSGGERKKVYLSLCFAVQPRWLILDEPTNSLDSRAKETLSKLISERRGVIMISHDDMLRSVSKHVYRLENGCIHNDEKE